MEAKYSDTKTNRYEMSWGEAYTRCEKRIKPYLKLGDRVFGIPRGGNYVAAMTGKACDKIEDAAILVDDIIDTGATEKEWAHKYGKKVFALVDKQSYHFEDKKLRWVVFPWEKNTIEEQGPAANVVRLLEYIGEDPTREGLIDTPERVLKALSEMTQGYNLDPYDILKKRFHLDNDEMIIVSPIRFSSLCEHHLLPFVGEASVGYIPKKQLVGLSKIPRLVLALSQRLQTQERLTNQIAKSFMEVVEPIGVGVVLKAHHSCMGCRGVMQPTANMITSSMLGVMRENPAARSEFLELIK